MKVFEKISYRSMTCVHDFFSLIGMGMLRVYQLDSTTGSESTLVTERGNHGTSWHQQGATLMVSAGDTVGFALSFFGVVIFGSSADYV